MSEKYTPVKGDRVRVVIEDVVIASADIEGTFETKNNWFEGTEGHVVSVEKIEPPLEVFKPGDVVRNRVAGNLLTLGRKGFLNHSTTNFHRYGKADPSIVGNGGKYLSLEQCTSDKYEKVSLG